MQLGPARRQLPLLLLLCALKLPLHLLQQLLEALPQLAPVVQTQDILADHQPSTHGYGGDGASVTALRVQQVCH